MKAYTQLIENKVMVSTLPKPERDKSEAPHPVMALRYALYGEALKAFESSILGEVENVWYGELSEKWFADIGEVDSEVIKSNQPCEVEGLTITKL